MGAAGDADRQLDGAARRLSPEWRDSTTQLNANLTMRLHTVVFGQRGAVAVVPIAARV